MLFEKLARQPVDEGEGRSHRGQVELGAAEIGMGLDAAIGDGKRAAVAGEQKFVGADAMGGELMDAAEPVARVVDADHAGGVVEIVLRGVEQRAIGREHSMAEEMAALDADNGMRRSAASMVEDHREGARLAREDDGAPRDGVERHVMAAIGKVEGEDELAFFRQDGNAETPVSPLEGSGEDRLGTLQGPGAARQQRGGQPRAGGADESATVDQRRHRSISIQRGKAGAEA